MRPVGREGPAGRRGTPPYAIATRRAGSPRPSTSAFSFPSSCCPARSRRGWRWGRLLPTLALFRDAARQRLPFAIVNRFFLPWNQLANFVLPRLHGHPFTGDWTARGNFWETCCYVGWLPFALAVWGAVSAWRGRGRSPGAVLALVFVFGVWMAMGGSGGLYHLAYFVLPGFRSFHDPARCLLWACFALSLLAGYGWEKIAHALPSYSPCRQRW